MAVATGLVLGAAGARAASDFDGFDPHADGNVYAVAIQSDGKVIIGGAFQTLRPNQSAAQVIRYRIARLNTDGTLDTTFDAGFDGDVTTLALQADGRIIVGGRFSHATQQGSLIPRNGLARLNLDGSLDATFDARLTGNAFPLGLVRTLAVQSDDRILVGGGFTGAQPLGTTAPVVRNRLLRLNADGTLDAGFDPNANNVVLALAVQPDGRIVVGGGFTRLQPNGAGTAIERLRLARLNADGTLDAAFDPRPDNRVAALALQVDGSIIVGGDFRALTPAGATTATTRTFIARLTPAGAIDSSFNPSPNAAVEMLAVQFDGRVLLGGRFVFVRPPNTGSQINVRYLARFHPDGTFDDTFAPNPSAQVAAVAQQSDGRLIVVGYFSSIRPANAGNIAPRNFIARLQTNGFADAPLTLGTSGSISIVVRQPDGRVLLGGSFTSIAGVSRSNLARLNADGTLDRAFAPVVDGQVAAIALQSDGSIVIGGSFGRVGTTERPLLARLSAAGVLDANFNPKPNGSITAIHVQSDNRILVGGTFTSFTPNSATEAITRNRLARLNNDGTIDTAYDPNPNSGISVIFPETDGRVLIGGAFTGLQPNATGSGVARGGIARLNTDGTVVADFAPATDGSVQTIALQADGKYLIGGSFTQVSSSGGTTVLQRNRLARLNPDGTFDTIFDPSPNSTVSNIVVLPNQRALISGFFSNFSNSGSPAAFVANNPVTERVFLAIISTASGTVDPAFTVRPNGSVNSIVVEPAGTLLLGGAFTGFFSGDATTPVESNLARLNPNTNAIDLSFRPQITPTGTERVAAITVESGGKYVLGGSFAELNGITRTNLVRIFDDGVPDGTFSATTNGAVNALLTLPDLDEVNEGPNVVAWLNSNGTLRSAFNHADTEFLVGTVRAMGVQSDGKLIVGGSFVITGGAGGANLARFNADGTLDRTFTPSPDGSVETLVVLSDNRILVGGTFSRIGANNDFDFMARLNADGTLDTAFKPTFNGSVFALALQSDGKVIAGGSFQTVQPPGSAAAITRNYLARLNTDSTLDTTFTPTINSSVFSLAVQGDGQILIGGAFTTVNTTARNTLARLQANGTLDANFNPTPNGSVRSIVVQPDSRVLIGGDFTTVQPNGATATTPRLYVARLESTGLLDTAFNPTPNAPVTAIALQADGRILLGGSFGSLTPNGASDFIIRYRLARLNADGTVDPGFNPISDNQVNAILVRSDTSIIIGGAFTQLSPDPSLLVAGDFTTISGAPFPYLARLNTDGSADAFFQPAPDGAVFALAAATNARVVVGGAFTTLGGLPRTRLAVLSANGTVDATFAPVIDGPVHSVAVDPLGSIVIGGTFTTVGGGAHAGIARVLATGAVDAGFNASADGTVTAIVVQPDGRLLIAGTFTTVNGTPRSRLARLNADGTLDAAFNPAPNGTVWTLALQANGQVLVGGEFTSIAGTARSRYARLNANGTLDGTVAPTLDASVFAIALRADGRPVIGGEFTNVNGRSSFLVARLAPTGVATQSINVNPARTSVTWTRGGTGAEFQSVIFAQSTDGTTWTDLGPGVRTGATGVWQWTGAALPANTSYFVRVTGELANTRYGSGSRSEVMWQFYNSTLAGWFAFRAGGAPAGGGSPSSDPTDPDPAGGPNGGGGSSPGGDGASGGDGSPGSGGSDGAHAPADTVPGLVNFSTRAEPAVGTHLITGFVIGGTETQRVLLRAIGPGLAAYDVSGHMSAPWLQLYDAAGNLLEESAAWGGAPALADIFTTTGAFALDPAKADAALFITLAPGAYTIHVRDSAGLSGVVLNEVYVADNSAGLGTRGLANLSTRGPVGTGSAVLIGGFAIGGDAPRRVLVRGIGPGLLGYAVTDAVADPSLKIYDAFGVLVAENNDWQAQSGGASASDVAATFTVTGAFSLGQGSTDAALVLTLAPGTYTAHVSGTAAGTALVEVYEIP